MMMAPCKIGLSNWTASLATTPAIFMEILPKF